MTWAENVRVEVKNVEDKRKKRQNQKKSKASVRKYVSSFLV